MSQINLNQPAIYSPRKLDASDFEFEQSSEDDMNVPFLLLQEKWEPASVVDTIYVLGGASLGLVVFAYVAFRFAVAIGWVS